MENNFDAVETSGDLHVELYDFRQDKILAQAGGVVGVRGRVANEGFEDSCLNDLFWGVVSIASPNMM